MFFVELNQFKAFLKPLKNVTLAMLSSEFVIYIFLQSNMLGLLSLCTFPYD